MQATPGTHLPGSEMTGECLIKEEGCFVQWRVGEAVGRVNLVKVSDALGTLCLCGSEQWCDRGSREVQALHGRSGWGCSLWKTSLCVGAAQLSEREKEMQSQLC